MIAGDTSVVAVLVHRFEGQDESTLSQVGGKGLSLIRTARAGLPVPPGFVLDVAFFAPWLQRLRETPAWQRFQAAVSGEAPDGLESCCRALKEHCHELELSEDQRAALDSGLVSFPSDALFAVRSSSPEEDLEGASFAGGYETVLGVTRATMTEALRRAFASCLDYRVAVYKREHGFGASTPRIAVVVQEQIPSEVAGVAFSMNPLNNSYDEAVINSNFGLGETVVAGLATPDTFVVDRVRRAILQRDTGSKETSIFLTAGGGTEERPHPDRHLPSLTDEQILLLTDLVGDVERLYQKSMDIEWAFWQGHLYLLQARPITTVIPLPDAMITPPGAKPRLYLDVTVSVQGLFKPISVMGTSALQRLVTAGCEEVFGKDISASVPGSFFFALEGRLYMNLSTVFAIVGRDKFADRFSLMDPVATATLAQVDEALYRCEKSEVKHLPLDVLWNLPDKALQLVEARLLPQQAYRGFQREVDRFVPQVRSLADRGLPLMERARELFRPLARLLFTQIIPLFLTSRFAMARIEGIFGPEEHHLVESLDRALPHNITVEMGLELYEAAALLPEDITLESLEAGIEARTLPVPFLLAWSTFLERYGHRGPMELDIRAPRYRDLPRLLMQQMVQLRHGIGSGKTPLEHYEDGQHERESCYEELAVKASALGWIQSRRFQSLYKVVETLGGIRESGKYYAIMALDQLRRWILDEARPLVAAGRLDREDDVFDLTLDDLDEALANPSLDLRARARERTAFPARLARVPELPRIIDSRGRIFRAPTRAVREGEVAGMAISSGVVRGPVKTLHSPDEKPVEQGDVLVARATDPGWTPLFVNACAVVLEVGGMLQHGALVAREYGKPCVAGVSNATELWADGTMVEVDGTAGIVRVIDPPG